MSSSSGRTCFDFALDALDWLLMEGGGGLPFHELSCYVENLKVEVRLLRTFDKCTRKWMIRSNQFYTGHCEEANCASFGCRIKELVSRIPNGIHSAYRTSGTRGAVSEIWRLLENVELLDTDIKELYAILLDQDRYSLGVPDPRQLVDLFDSLLENLVPLPVFYCKFKFDSRYNLYDLVEDLREKLMFLKNFISFVTRQGVVEDMQLIPLLIHIQVLAFNAARLIYVCWLDRFDREVGNKMEFEISQLLQKVNPVNVDPQVRETYIHVLTASKLSRSLSSHIFSPQKDGHIVAVNILDFLLDNLMEILESYTSFRLSVKDQMQKLHEGLRFLRNLLGEQHEKFNQLHDQMKDLIGVAVVDAGILMYSLSINEMKEGLAKETDIAAFHILKVLQFIMAEVAHIYSPMSSSFSFPRTNNLGSIDFLLENLKELETCEVHSVTLPKDQILTVQENLVFLTSFLQNIAEQCNKNEKLQALWSRVMEVAYKAELIIDSIMVRDKRDCSPLSLDIITEEIKFLKTVALENYDSVRHGTPAPGVTKTYSHMPSQVSAPAFNEFFVSLDEEVKTIIDGLTLGSKQLDIVSIVGMPGVGKTTLANQVYKDPLIMYHFHVLSWCTVSQVYSKHSLLLQILGDTGSKSSNKYLKMNEHDLAEELYKSLKGKRYFIVLDDVWDIDAWNSLKGSLPDDANGSRILFTSRSHNLCLLFKFDSKPHHLRLLTDKESWELLQNKLFGKKGCHPALAVVGMQIAKNCKGLPLAVVIVAGILASIEQDCWEEVGNSLGSSTVIGTEHCMKTLELSYRHLPDYLKSCLLYLGAFQEDQEIPVRRLLWLWMSEGFVQKNELKSLEDVAHEYLMDLIGRSLVMVTQKRSIGGVKSCRIHDLLHEFCVAKAKEESFLQILHGYNELFTSTRPYKPHRLCIYSIRKKELKMSRLFFPHLRCLLFFPYSRFIFRRQCHPDSRFIFARQRDYSFIFRIFKLLRVLDFGEVHLGQNFRWEVELLVHLRYLAIRCDLTSIPSGIANLSRLETFLIAGSTRGITLPNTIWNMKKMRHLCSSAGFTFPTENLELFLDLYDLDTLTLKIDSSSQNLQKIIKKLPSIRRLKCLTTRVPIENLKGLIMLDYLGQLESLQMVGSFFPELAFPLNLKKLTLSSYWKPWREISTIGKLPNLEVLKLLENSFMGENWEMEEGEFFNLRYLKLESLNINRWSASCDNIPYLQKLVLQFCNELKEVPFCLRDIPTIEMIEVKQCHKSTVSLVKQIQEVQMDMGNTGLKIVIQE
ncbi:hypothetical protein ACH5RR_012603 [Cinchona calisaya]|uniref:Late blight resistance protein homolog R1A-3 n=1 Tax=Cinchona calisaya TaxID=153742 RepID=A0ABD3AAU7_9GENT